MGCRSHKIWVTVGDPEDAPTHVVRLFSAYLVGKIEEMNASTCAPADLGGAGRASIRLSLLARAWLWLWPLARGALSGCARSGGSP